MNFSNRIKSLLGIDTAEDEPVRLPVFLDDDIQVLSAEQRNELDALSDYVQFDDPDHPKSAPGNEWEEVENRLTKRGFEQLGCGHDRVVYRLPYDGLQDKVVKFARESAVSRKGFHGAAQNAAESSMYRDIFWNYPEAVSYFNTIHAKDNRSETFRWLIMDAAEPAKDMYQIDEVEERFGIRPTNPEIGIVDDKPVYIDYGEGYEKVNDEGHAIRKYHTFYQQAKKDQGGNANRW